MKYFPALRVGQKRVQAAREYLNKLTNDKAMPALALIDNKENVWQPVGEENFFAVIDESSGYVLTDTSGSLIAICDKNGISKAIVQGVTKEQKDILIENFKKDNVPEYKGKVSLPV